MDMKVIALIFLALNLGILVRILRGKKGTLTYQSNLRFLFFDWDNKVQELKRDTEESLIILS